MARSTADILSDLARAFPRHPMTADTLRVYVRELRDVPVGLVEASVRVLIRTSEFFPTVHAIRRTCAELGLALPTEEEALAQIEARIEWGRRPEDERAAGTPPFLDPVVKTALDHVGGWYAFRAADEPSVIRGQFLRLFRDMRATRIREAQIDGAVLPPGQTRAALDPASEPPPAAVS